MSDSKKSAYQYVDQYGNLRNAYQDEIDRQSVGKEPVLCDFCRKNPFQFTVSHEGILMTDFTNAETQIYLFCGLCFFANVKHFLRMLHEKI